MTGMFYEIMPGYGYCLNVDDAHDTVRVYQEQTQNRYCASVKTPSFGSVDVRARPRKVFWEDDQKEKVKRECLLYDGVPFHILGKKIFFCEFGKNRNRTTKTVKDKKGNDIIVPTATKKKDCPAFIYMKEVMKYPAYVIEENTPAVRTKMAEKLRNDYLAGNAQGERRFYIVFPNIKEHQNHAVYYEGSLVRPEDIECPSDASSPNIASAAKKTDYAQLCRGVIDDLESFLKSNRSEEMLLNEAESMLEDVLQFFSADPPIRQLLSS